MTDVGGAAVLKRFGRDRRDGERDVLEDLATALGGDDDAVVVGREIVGRGDVNVSSDLGRFLDRASLAGRAGLILSESRRRAERAQAGRNEPEGLRHIPLSLLGLGSELMKRTRACQPKSALFCGFPALMAIAQQFSFETKLAIIPCRYGNLPFP